MRLDVFNTEAHPFKVPPALSTYGTGNPTTPSWPFTTVPGALPSVSAMPSVPGLVFGPLAAVLNEVI